MTREETQKLYSANSWTVHGSRFSMVYMMCTIPVGFFAMWAGRRFGLRSAILIAGIIHLT